MRPRALIALALAAAALALAPASASAAFGFQDFDVAIQHDRNLGADAGSHPYELRIGTGLNTTGGLSDGDLRDLSIDLPPGLLLNPMSTAQCVAGLCDASSAAGAVCSPADFNTPRGAPRYLSGERCPDSTQVGTLAVTSRLGGSAETRTFGLFNISPPYGAPMAIGASPYGIPVVFTPYVREGDAGLTFRLRNLSQARDFQRLDLTLWGTPWGTPTDYSHETQRGDCLNEEDPLTPYGTASVLTPSFTRGSCAIGDPSYINTYAKSLITLPPGPCGIPLDFAASARSWDAPAATAAAADQANDGQTLGECKFSLTVPKAQLTTRSAGSGSGLVFTLDATAGGGIFNPGGVSLPSIKRAVIALPEGLTVNPSVASGLQGCTPAQFAQETLNPAPGTGCPDASKVGVLRVDEMMGLPTPVEGSLYLATPHDNPLGSLIALYIVTRSQERGLLVRSVGKLEPDPRTGRLVTTFDNLPRLLYTRFTLSLREGLRPMFVTPLSCGSYTTDAPSIASWADTSPHPLTQDTSTFIVDRGHAGGPCPPPVPPFAPGLQAGSINPAAAFHTPFYLQMTRSDQEQEITSYSATFPPGLLGKVAGVPWCPEGALDAAKAKSGAEEAAAPSCPAASQIGTTLSGYGVGGILAWAPGKLYLAGPYKGAPLSVIAVNSAQIGPFDLGTVVVRSGIRIDRETAQASIDATGADPIPHILAGIPLHLRDIRVFVDRPVFILNPTNCAPLQVASALTGAGANLFDGADDSRATTTTPFNLLDCSALGFRPRLAFRLRGKTKHGAYPALRAAYTPRPGHANLAGISVTLPESLFLAQEHIARICTRAQSLAKACPRGSVYGHARAFTPLLDRPLHGPVYLRASDNLLPDLVFALRGPGGLEVALPGRIGSRGERIAISFANLPDAPISKFVINMRGGKRSLLINAENLCRSSKRAAASYAAHSGKAARGRPSLKPRCAKGKKGKRKGKKSRGKRGRGRRGRDGASASEAIQRGNLRIAFDGKLTPRALPRHGSAPVRVEVGARITSADGKIPAQLRRIAIEINRNGRLDPTGIPVCRLSAIQPATTENALAACRRSVVGEGRFSAKVVLSEQAPFPSEGKVIAFNGREGGRPAILAHVYGTKPVPTSYTLVFSVRPGKGKYGTVLRASLPKVTGRWGYVTGLSLKLGRTFSRGGKRHGYLNASCPAPAGFPGALFPFARVSMGFDNGRNITQTITRTCRVRG